MSYHIDEPAGPFPDLRGRIILVPSQDLRAHLSDYLQRARQGERITITVHGRPVAVLGPYEPDGGDAKRAAPVIDRARFLEQVG